MYDTAVVQQSPTMAGDINTATKIAQIILTAWQSRGD